MSKRMTISTSHGKIHVEIKDGQFSILNHEPIPVDLMTQIVKFMRKQGIELATPYGLFQPDQPPETVALQFCLCG